MYAAAGSRDDSDPKENNRFPNFKPILTTGIRQFSDQISFPIFPSGYFFSPNCFRYRQKPKYKIHMMHWRWMISPFIPASEGNSSHWRTSNSVGIKLLGFLRSPKSPTSRRKRYFILKWTKAIVFQLFLTICRSIRNLAKIGLVAGLFLGQNERKGGDIGQIIFSFAVDWVKDISQFEWKNGSGVWFGGVLLKFSPLQGWSVDFASFLPPAAPRVPPQRTGTEEFSTFGSF